MRNPIDSAILECLQVCAHWIKYSIRGSILKVYGHSFGSLCWYSCNQSGLFFFIVQNEFCAFVLFVHLDELSARSVGRRSIGCSFAVCVWLWYFSVLTVNLYFWEKELMPLRYGTPFSFILSLLLIPLARSIFFILCLSNWSIFLSALRPSNCRYTYKRTYTRSQTASQAGSQTKWKEQNRKCLTNTKSLSEWVLHSTHTVHGSANSAVLILHNALHSSTHTHKHRHSHSVFLFNCFNMFNSTICANLIINCVYDFIHHLICCSVFAHSYKIQKSAWFAKVHFERDCFGRGRKRWGLGGRQIIHILS